MITRFALTFSSQNILGRIKDKWGPLPAAGRYRMYTPNLLYDFSSDKETAPTYLSLGKLEWERMRREDKKNLSTWDLSYIYSYHYLFFPFFFTSIFLVSLTHAACIHFFFLFFPPLMDVGHQGFGSHGHQREKHSLCSGHHPHPLWILYVYLHHALIKRIVTKHPQYPTHKKRASFFCVCVWISSMCVEEKNWEKEKKRRDRRRKQNRTKERERKKKRVWGL